MVIKSLRAISALDIEISVAQERTVRSSNNATARWIDSTRCGKLAESDILGDQRCNLLKINIPLIQCADQPHYH
jgi:hypothetical protein